MQINIKYKLFFIIFIMFFCNFNGFINAEDEIWYVEYNKGDKIEYNGIDFYVIEDSDKTKDYVTLLKAEPFSAEEINQYGTDENGINHVNRYTSSSVGTAFDEMKYGEMAYYTSENCGYVNGTEKTDGCASENATSYDSSDIKYVVDNWAKSNFKDKELVKDNLGYKTRLLTLDELLKNFSYTEYIGPTDISYSPGEDTPKWIYQYEYLENYSYDYNYWLMNPYQDSSSKVWTMTKLMVINSLTQKHYAVRPVINVKKESIRTGNSYRVKSVTSKEFKIGDVVEYNGVKFYAIENSSENKNTVALLKAEPLTTAEVNKYGKGFVNKDTEKKEAIDKNGYGRIAYYSSDTCTGYTDNPIGCTADYDKSDIKYVVDNWSKDVLGGLNLIEDETGYKVRLITKEEIINNLSFTVSNSGIYHASIDTPYWVYSDLYTYLTMSPADDSNSNVLRVDSFLWEYSSAMQPTYGYSNFIGVVRPVIILAKNLDNTITEKVEVPNTNLSAPLILGVIATVIIITSFIIVYVVLKKKKGYKKL